MSTPTIPTAVSTSATASASWQRRLVRAGLLAAPVTLCLLATTACFDEEGSGDIATYRVEDFVDPEVTGLSVLADINVNVRVDPDLAQSAQLRIDDNLADRAMASVTDGILTIGTDGLGDLDPTQTPVLDLTVKRLDVIENHGTGTIDVIGLSSGELDVVNSDDGALRASGTADTIDLSVSGAGSVDLGGLVARRVELSDTDDGPIVVHATESVDGSITGDGDVVVRGQPATTDVDLDGDGALLTS